MKISVATCHFPVDADISRNEQYVVSQVRSARELGADVAHFPEAGPPVRPRRLRGALCVLKHMQIDSLIDAFVEKINSQPREMEALDEVPPCVREGVPDELWTSWRIVKSELHSDR
jgi:hypothetical protein